VSSRVVLVSDAMVAMGLPDGTYSFGDAGSVDVVDGGSAVYRTGSTTLAGAVTPLDECVRRYAAYTGCGAAAALEAASLHPAQVLGIDRRKGALVPGADADLLILDDDLHVRRCFIGGEQVWPARGAPTHDADASGAPAGVAAASAGHSPEHGERGARGKRASPQAGGARDPSRTQASGADGSANADAGGRKKRR
jgi:hypothetical protein